MDGRGNPLVARNSPEDARLDALHRLNLLDTGPSESFDRITRLASQIFDLPISAISLTDFDRQWFKSRIGVAHQSIPRDKAPCAAVVESRDMLVVSDLLADPYYATSVLAGTGARFYAGAPLVTPEGHGLGALCVIGTSPRDATPAEMAALRDLAAMVMAQIELQHAFGRVDPISGLPNRTQFLDDLDDLARDKPGERRLVILVDLIRPEQLNTIVRVLGSSYVDDMVQDAVRELRVAVPDKRAIYHVAATQFVFLARADATDAEIMAELRQQLAARRRNPTIRFVAAAAVGVAPFVANETSSRDVLRIAHSAAQDARSVETGVSLYSTANDNIHQRRFQLLEDFRVALERQPEQLRIVVQPRIDLASGRCDSAEVLLRWQHPTLGNVSPAEFIPMVENSALARPLTAWVLGAAMGQLRQWRAAGLEIVLSVNVSAANLDQADFATDVQLALLKHQLRPEFLELEVTESAIMRDAAHALAQLNALDEAGIRIAIDDFGTGYSSLNYLQRLPASVVKIDQSFIREMGGSDKEATLVRSMIALSHDLGYRVVAEGVETEADAATLRTLRCDEAQGFLFARPMELADLAAWCADQASGQRRLVAA